MSGSYKIFKDYFPKYPPSGPLYDRIAGSLVKSTLVAREQRRIRVALETEDYLSREECEQVAQAIREAYSLAQVTLRCCCQGCRDPQALSDAVRELREDDPILRSYMAGEAAFADGELVLPVLPAGLAIMEAQQTARKVREYFFFKLGLELSVALKDRDEQQESAQEYFERKEKSIDRSTPVSAVPSGAEGAPERVFRHGEALYGKDFAEEPIRISDLKDGMKIAVVCGQADSPRKRVYLAKPDEEAEGEAEGKERAMLSFSIEDSTGVLPVKIFSTGKVDSLLESLHAGDRVFLRGSVAQDSFAGGLSMRCFSICRAEEEGVCDRSPQKRIELHAHTFSSALDATVSAEKLVEAAARWEHPALAITDHASLHSLPAAFRAGREKGVKILAGEEVYLADDETPYFFGSSEMPIKGDFTVFDIETTGLSSLHDRITEIGAVRIKNGSVGEEFSMLVNPEMPIPKKITELTGISNAMLVGAPKIREALAAFLAFAGDSVLVAHNAHFDCGFIRTAAKNNGMEFNNPYIDTVPLCNALYPATKNAKLDTIATYLGLGSFNHHRACDDAQMLARIFQELLETAHRRFGVDRVDELNRKVPANLSRLRRYHATVLARDEEGLRALNELTSRSYLDYYFRKPAVPKSQLRQKRAHLLIGSACYQGELFEALTQSHSEAEIEEKASFYDFFELQPMEAWMHMVDTGRIHDSLTLQGVQRRILELAERFGKPAAATGDVHFADQDGEAARNVLTHFKSMRWDDTEGPLYYRSTDQMLLDFRWLGEEKAKELVIEAPARLAEACSLSDALPEPVGFAPDPEDDRRLARALEQCPQERERAAEQKALFDTALTLHRMMPEIRFGRPLSSFQTAFALGLTDEVAPEGEACRELEISLPDCMRSTLQKKLDALLGFGHAPFAGEAFCYTAEAAKRSIIRYEEENHTVLREIAENRYAAAIEGSVRQLRANPLRMILIPPAAPEGAVPLGGTKEEYFTHIDGNEYIGRFPVLQICEDPGARMLRLCEYMSGVPASDIEAGDEECLSLRESAEALMPEYEFELPNGISGCEGYSETVTYRLLWYKLYYPQEFYAAYFSVHFSPELAGRGQMADRLSVERQVAAGGGEAVRVEYEMLSRGIAFSPISLFTAQFACFMPDEQGNIMLPMRVLEGFTEKDADKIIAARQAEQYLASSDLIAGSGVSRPVAAMLSKAGLATTDDAQMKLF